MQANDNALATSAGSNGTWQIKVPLKVGTNYVSVAGGARLVSFTIRRLQTAAEKAAAIQRAAAARQAAAQRAAAAKQAAAQKAANERQSFINAAKTIPYAELVKDTGPYVGQKIVLHGQIFQIQQQQGHGGIMLLAVTNDGYGNWSDNVWVDYDNDVPYVQNDVINVYGTVTGTKSYKTQVGGNTYVPEVHAVYVASG